MKKSLVILALSLLIVPCFSQIKQDEERSSINICWYTDLDTAATYLIYFNRYNTPDTAWRLIGTTKEKTFLVQKQGFKGDIAFGVRAVYYDDTSAMHTSLDSTACAEFGSQCDTSCATGSWYISWHIGRPSLLSIW